MLGSNVFTIVHDGAGFDRVQKLAALAGWAEALDELRVCVDDPEDRGRNCGRCNKCVLTRLTFRVLELEPRCFDRLPSDRDVLAWIPNMPSHPFYVHEARALLAEADARGIAEPWTRALQRKLRRVHVKDVTRRAWPAMARRTAGAHRRVRARFRG
jgi:hypothetical protein